MKVGVTNELKEIEVEEIKFLRNITSQQAHTQEPPIINSLSPTNQSELERPDNIADLLCLLLGTLP